MLLARRMFGRDVQRREIVKILLDMRPLGDDETHLAKDRDDLVDRLADRVNAARCSPVCTGKVTSARSPASCAARAARPSRSPASASAAAIASLTAFSAAPASRRASGASAPEAAHQFGQTAAPPERGDADRLERVRRLRSADLAEDLVAQSVCVFHQQFPKNKGAVMRPLRSQQLSGASVHPSPGKSRDAPNASHGQAAFAWAPSSADLISPTTAAKASGSRIAMSDSTLRSSSSPASFSPCINCE